MIVFFFCVEPPWRHPENLTSQATPGPLPPATTTDHGSSWGPGNPAASPFPPNMTYENRVTLWLCQNSY